MVSLVRRARKSIRERRMKECQTELSKNLDKVEMRVHVRKTKVKAERMRVRGTHVAPIPQDVLAGKMNPELYEIECRLHAEAGLPPPAPYEGYEPIPNRRTIGFVSFHTFIKIVRQMKGKK
eukprot:Tbor_TRINITY_DN2198_c0_g1::TRINITY_DN2198_c0_g1_i1::g.5504::m.5504